MPPKKTTKSSKSTRKRKSSSGGSKKTSKRARTNIKTSRPRKPPVLVIRQEALPDKKQPAVSITKNLFVDRDVAMDWCQDDFIATIEEKEFDNVNALPKDPQKFIEHYKNECFAESSINNAPLAYTIIPMNQTKKGAKKDGTIKLVEEEVDLKELVPKALEVLTTPEENKKAKEEEEEEDEEDEEEEESEEVNETSPEKESPKKSANKKEEAEAEAEEEESGTESEEQEKDSSEE
jgi:hypothetical protein